MTRSILAQNTLTARQMLDRMGSPFREPDPDLWWKIPLVLGLLAVALLLVWVLAYLERRRAENDHSPQPMHLFLEALAVMRLGWVDRWVMWRLARGLRLPHPAALLIASSYFDQAVTQYCRDRTFHGDALRRRFAAIRRRLFG